MLPQMACVNISVYNLHAPQAEVEALNFAYTEELEKSLFYWPLLLTGKSFSAQLCIN
jgi:hypothetical protein